MNPLSLQKVALVGLVDLGTWTLFVWFNFWTFERKVVVGAEVRIRATIQNGVFVIATCGYASLA